MLNDIDAELHHKIHKQMLRADPATIFKPRTKVFTWYTKHFDAIRGRVLDVGAGNGYASIWLALHCPQISEVVALEASAPAVKELIPRNAAFHGVDSIVVPRLGSFDSHEEAPFDFIVAMGALHHSMDLYRTFRNLAHLLKPGGILIAQEPAMPDTTSHAQYGEKYDIVEEFYGLRIRNGDRHDHFFRECEYKCAAVLSGFDILEWSNWHDYSDLPARALSLLRRKLAAWGTSAPDHTLSDRDSDPSVRASEPAKNAMKRARKGLKNKLMVARRSHVNSIYHPWAPA